MAEPDRDTALAETLRAGAALLERPGDAAARDALLEANLAALRADVAEPARWRLQAALLAQAGDAAQAAACQAAADRLVALEPAPSSPDGEGPSAALAATVGAPDPATQRLSVSMIVRDEAAMLPDCLASVLEVADEIVVLDTGSTDDTAAIARAAGAKVVDFTWTGSFADARNASLDQATGDWILCVDADERLEAGHDEALRRALARTWLAAQRVDVLNLTGEAGMSAPLTASSLRLWRRSPRVRWEGAVHEQLTGLPREVGERFGDAGVRLVHHGYRTDVIESAGKRDRNLELLLAEAARPGGDDPFVAFNVGSEYLMRGEHAEAVRWLSRAAARTEPAAAYAPRLALRLTRSLRLGGDAASGEATAERWLAVLPDHTDLAVERALCTADAGDPARALILLDEALALGDGPSAYGSTAGMAGAVGRTLRGEMLMRLERHAEAAEELRAALAADPDHLAGLGRLAAALLAAGAPPAAVAEELTPHARAHLRGAGPLLATALYERGAVEEAEALFRETLAAHPDAVDARVGLAECAMSRGDTEEAAAVCDPLPAAPQGGALARAAGFCHLVDGRADAAAAVLAAAPAAGLPEPEQELYAAWLAALGDDDAGPLSPPAAEAGLEALTTTIRLERLPAVDVLYRLLRESRMEPARLRGEIARRFFAAGHVDIALEEWSAVISEHGPDGPAYLGLAQVALTRGMAEEARSLAEAALQESPDLTLARHLLERLDAIGR
jgi:tetratricopeptide (TPR) repeat protein